MANAVWGEAEFSKVAPTPERGKYLWQRVRQDNGEWTYIRLTTSGEEASEEYLGILTTEPSADEPHMVGDAYVDGSEGGNYAIKVWTGTRWSTLSESGLPDSKIAVICAKAQKDVLSHIDPGSVTASDYAYFNNIIAGTVTADYIKSQQGVFDNISVRGDVSASKFRFNDIKLMWFYEEHENLGVEETKLLDFKNILEGEEFYGDLVSIGFSSPTTTGGPLSVNNFSILLTDRASSSVGMSVRLYKSECFELYYERDFINEGYVKGIGFRMVFKAGYDTRISFQLFHKIKENI